MKTFYERTIIVPSDKAKTINPALARHGYGPDNLSVPIVSKSDDKVVTYYGCNITMTAVMKQIIEEVVVTVNKCESFIGDFKTEIGKKNLQVKLKSTDTVLDA